MSVDWDAITAVLWTSTGHGVDFELCDDEAEAADLGAFLESGGSDDVYEVLGVQFSSGRVVPAKLWLALTEAIRARKAKEQERRDNPPPPIPTKKITCPFTGRPVKAEIDTPDWIGQPYDSRP